MADEVAYLAAKWGVPTAVALVFVACRLLCTSARWTLRSVVRAILVGVVVGNLAALWADEIWQLSNAAKFTAVAVGSILAEDIVATVLSFGRKLRENPAEALSMLRGKKP